MASPSTKPTEDLVQFDRYTLIRTRFFEVFYKKKGVLNDKQNQKNLYTRI